MNPTSKDISDILVNLGQGVFASQLDWGIYIGNEPTSPSKCITLYDTNGRVPGYYANKSLEPTQRNSLQVRVRSTSYLSAHNKLYGIACLLEQYGRFDKEGYHYTSIHRTSDFLFLERQESDLCVWVTNFNIEKEKI